MEALDGNVPPEAGHPLFEAHLQESHIPDKTVNVLEVSTPYSRKKQVAATVCATMGCFLNGGAIGYTGPANPSLMDPKDKTLYGGSLEASFQAISWITSILGLGAFLGAFSSGFIMDKLGRRKTLLYIASPLYLIGYALIFFSSHLSMIYIGRFVSGMALGLQLSAVTVYILEIATIDMRGFLGCFVQLLGCVGIVFTFCIGAAVDWKYLALANGLWGFVFAGCMWVAPESPRWLILKGREFSAVRSLEWLRGKEERPAIDKEIDIIKRDIAQNRKQRVSMRDLLQHWRPFLVALIMMFILNFSGFNVLVYYTINIFQLARSSVNHKVACIIVGVTLLISCILAVLVVAKLNRRLMLIISIFGMAVSQFIIGWCMSRNEEILRKINEDVANANLTALQLPANTTTDELHRFITEATEFPQYLGWLPLVAVLAFLFLGNGGYGTLIWVVTAELLPPKVRSAANSFCICFGFVGGFIVAKTFVDLISAIQNSGTFYLYSSICFAGFLFTFLFVPETKHRTAEQIDVLLRRSFWQKVKDAFKCT